MLTLSRSGKEDHLWQLKVDYFLHCVFHQCACLKWRVQRRWNASSLCFHSWFEEESKCVLQKKQKKNIDALKASSPSQQKWTVIVFFGLVCYFIWYVKCAWKAMKTMELRGGGKKILYECAITRERGLMVNKYKKWKYFYLPLEAPWLCTIWAAHH